MFSFHGIDYPGKTKLPSTIADKVIQNLLSCLATATRNDWIETGEKSQTNLTHAEIMGNGEEHKASI